MTNSFGDIGPKPTPPTTQPPTPAQRDAARTAIGLTRAPLDLDREVHEDLVDRVAWALAAEADRVAGILTEQLLRNLGFTSAADTVARVFSGADEDEQ